MKKVALLFTILTLLISLCACGSTAPQEPPHPGAVATPAPMPDRTNQTELKKMISYATDIYDLEITVIEIDNAMSVSVFSDGTTPWCFANIVYCTTTAIKDFMGSHDAKLSAFDAQAIIGKNDGKEICMMWYTKDLDKGLFIDESTDTTGNATLEVMLEHCDFDPEW